MFFLAKKPKSTINNDVVIKMSRERSQDKDDVREIFSIQIGKLPKTVQAKLKAMSAEELTALFEKSGL